MNTKRPYRFPETTINRCLPSRLMVSSGSGNVNNNSLDHIIGG